MILEALLGTLFFLLILATVYRPKNFPPGPIPLPIVGNCLEFFDASNLSEKFYKKYGGFTGIVVGLLRRGVFVTSYEALNEVLQSDDCIGRPDVCLTRDRFDGETRGLFMTEGEAWKHNRAFTLQKFRELGFGRKVHESIILEEVQELVKEIESKSGSPNFYENLFYSANINIIWKIISGTRYPYEDEDFKELGNNIKMLLHDIQIFGSLGAIIPWLRYIFPKSTGYYGLKYGSRFIRKFSQKAIDEHKKLWDPTQQCTDDFIDLYLAQMRKSSSDEMISEYFSEKELIGICCDLLLGGSDTTTGHIGFCLLFLSIRQDIQNKIFEEILENVGPDRQISIADKPNLIYTEAFLMEVLRYRTVVPYFAPHKAVRDTILGGYNVPKDTVIFPMIKNVFSDAKIWNDPENLRPERFIGPNGKIQKHDCYFPFGKGKRNCIGENISKMSTFIVIGTLVQKFHLKLPEGSKPNTEGIPGFTFCPHPYELIANVRQ